MWAKAILADLSAQKLAQWQGGMGGIKSADAARIKDLACSRKNENILKTKARGEVSGDKDGGGAQLLPR